MIIHIIVAESSDVCVCNEVPFNSVRRTNWTVHHDVCL